MPLPWRYIAHVCWVFCVLSFFASDVASGAVVRVLRALQHGFASTFLGRSAFMVEEPCLHPCTLPHILNGCRRVGSWESGSIRRKLSTTPSLSFKLNNPRACVCVKAKAQAKPEPEELSKKKKEKTKSPPKKKSKGKQKVEEKPKHVCYAVEGEPHRTMPTGATRGEKYQAGAAYDNDVQAMQRTLESDYEVSLGRVCQHYKVCLAEETQARRELGLALLLVTDVRAYNVQMVLRCGTKNAQSTAAARELFEERYRSSSPRKSQSG